MTNAQKFMTAVQDNVEYNEFAVVALRKEVSRLQAKEQNLINEVKQLDDLLNHCLRKKQL